MLLEIAFLVSSTKPDTFQTNIERSMSLFIDNPWHMCMDTQARGFDRSFNLSNSALAGILYHMQRKIKILVQLFVIPTIQTTSTPVAFRLLPLLTSFIFLTSGVYNDSSINPSRLNAHHPCLSHTHHLTPNPIQNKHPVRPKSIFSESLIWCPKAKEAYTSEPSTTFPSLGKRRRLL